MNRLFKLMLIFLLSISMQACGSPKKDIPVEETSVPEDVSEVTPLLYKASHENGAEVWLLGSIHLGVDEMYPLPDYVMDAYDSADILAVECDIVEVESDYGLMMEIMEKMAYTDGTTISEHISPELYEEAVEILEENNYYNKMLDYYIPSFWYSTISSFGYDEMGYDIYLGVDRFFLEQAVEDEKEISEIESAEEQYEMLADFSPELQELLLEEAVDTYGSFLNEFGIKMLMEAWCDGNEEKLQYFVTSDVSALEDSEIQELYDEFYDAMYVKRNIVMTDYAEDALLNGEKVFICVGAAHVVAEDGIVDLLKQRGYAVDKVN